MTDDVQPPPLLPGQRALEVGLLALVLCLALVKWANEVRSAFGAPVTPKVGDNTLDRLATSSLWYLALAITIAALLALAHYLRRVTRALRLSITATEPLTVASALAVARAWWNERTSGLRTDLTVAHFLLAFGAVLVTEQLVVGALIERGHVVDAQGERRPLGEVAPVGTSVRVRLIPALGEVTADVTGGDVLVDGARAGPGRIRLRDGAVLVAGGERLEVHGVNPSAFFGASLVGRLLGLGVLLGAALRIAGRAGVAALGLTTTGFGAEVRRGARGYLAALPAYVLVLAIWTTLTEALGITPAAHPLVEILEREGPRLAAITFVHAALITPLQEELLYRGLLLPAYARVLGVLGAVVASSLVFGAMHPGFLSLAPITLIGALFASLYVTSRHRSLVASITAHALFNGVTLIVVIGVQLG